jgi:uncharacterized protein
MPVRSLTSSVLRWPDAGQVDAAVRRWARRIVAEIPGVLRVGYVGSYARGNWGPGSDVDLIVVVRQAIESFERRASRWDTTELPVPADLIVYTDAEWRQLDPASRWVRTLTKEAIWLETGPATG